jgi:hypothetical protein
MFGIMLSGSRQTVYVSGEELTSGLNMTDDLDFAEKSIAERTNAVLNKAVVSKNDKAAAEVVADGKIVKYDYSAEGVNVSDISQKDNKISFKVYSNAEGLGKVTIFAKTNDGKIKESTVYTFTMAQNTFLSNDSEDEAWYRAYLHQYEQGLITDAEVEDAYAEFSRRDIIDEGPSAKAASETSAIDSDGGIRLMAASGASTYVKGRLTWTLADGKIMPLKLTRVDLYDKELIGAKHLSTAYTDINGYYSFSFQNPDGFWDFEGGGYDVFIRFYPDSYTFEVARDWLFNNLTYYYIESNVTQNVSTGSTTEYNINVGYNEGNNTNKSFYVAQGLVNAQRFAMNVGGMSSSKKLNVIYPFANATSFCWDSFMGIGQPAFDLWDTLTHEYGHYVEGVMGTYGVDLATIIVQNVNMEHFASEDHIYDKASAGKTFAMELTWSEGWATAFAQIAQQYYKSEYDVLPYFGLSITDYEEYSPDPLESGEGQENAIVAYLWDLYDPYSESEGGDQISLGARAWWNATTQSGTHTFMDFAVKFDAQYPQYRNAAGERMGFFHIAPSDLTVVNAVNATAPPILTWKVNGSAHNPNNRFQVVFYDVNGNQKYITANISSNQANDSIYTYSVTAAQWNAVLANFSGTAIINIAVKGYLTGTPVSGPYISAYKTVSVVLPSKTLTIAKNNRYTEEIVSLNAGEYKEYIVTFVAGGQKLIQTFGPKDSYLELYDSSGVKIAGNSSTDDAGYSLNALITYNVSANTPYKIKVRFYSTSQSGSTRLAIVSAAIYNQYENIYISPTDGSSYSANLTVGRVELLRYTSATTKTLTIQTDSSVDTYLYLIDPRSAEPISSNFSMQSVYNDDGGVNLQAKITKTIDANIPYLIIVAAYNPATSSGSFILKFS